MSTPITIAVYSKNPNELPLLLLGEAVIDMLVDGDLSDAQALEMADTLSLHAVNIREEVMARYRKAGV